MKTALKVGAIALVTIGTVWLLGSIMWERSQGKFESELQGIRSSLNAEVPLGSDLDTGKKYFADHRFQATMVDYRNEPELEKMFGATVQFVGFKGAQSEWTPSFVGCGTGGRFEVTPSYSAALKLSEHKVKPAFNCM